MGSCFAYPSHKALETHSLFWNLLDQVLKTDNTKCFVLVPNQETLYFLKYFKNFENRPEIFCLDSFLANLQNTSLSYVRWHHIKVLKDEIEKNKKTLPKLFQHPSFIRPFLETKSLLERMGISVKDYSAMLDYPIHAETVTYLIEAFTYALSIQEIPSLYPNLDILKPFIQAFCQDKTVFLIGFSDLKKWDKACFSLLCDFSLTSSWLLPPQENISDWLDSKQAKFIQEPPIFNPDLLTEKGPAQYHNVHSVQEEIEILISHCRHHPEKWAVLVPQAFQWQLVHALKERQIPVSYSLEYPGSVVSKWLHVFNQFLSFKSQEFISCLLAFLELPFLHLWGIRRDFIHKVLQKYPCYSFSELIKNLRYYAKQFLEAETPTWLSEQETTFSVLSACFKPKQTWEESKENLKVFLMPLSTLPALRDQLEWFWNQLKFIESFTPSQQVLKQLSAYLNTEHRIETQLQENGVVVLNDPQWGYLYRPYCWVFQASVQQWSSPGTLSLFFSKEWQKKLGLSKFPSWMMILPKLSTCYGGILSKETPLKGFILSVEIQNKEQDPLSFPIQDVSAYETSAKVSDPAFFLKPKSLSVALSTPAVLCDMGLKSSCNSPDSSFSMLQQSLYTQEKCFSATRLEQFQRCGLQYYWQHHLKVVAFEETSQQSWQKEWGIFVHRFLDLAFKKNILSTKKRENIVVLLEELSQKFHSVYWEVKKEMLLMPGTGILDQLLHHLDAFEFSIIETELPFEIKLWYSEQEHYLIQGKIDALLNQDNWYFVLDYKTGSQVASGASLKNHDALQLSLYYLAAEERYKKIAGAGFFHIKDLSTVDIKIPMINSNAKELLNLGKKRPFSVNDLFFENLKSKVLELISEIQKGHFEWAKDTTVCRYCAYKTLCHRPQRWDTQWH